MTYRIDKSRVLWNGRAVRNADAAAFQDLGHGWAKDNAGAYCEGRKVANAKAEDFRVLSGAYAVDSKRIFFRPGNVGEVDSALYADISFDPDQARVIESGRLSFLISGRVWVNGDWLAQVSEHPETFQALGRDYCKDHAQVWWVNADAVQPVRVMEADPETFVVDADGAHDKNGAFLAANRDTSERLPIQQEEDLAAAAERLVGELWNTLIADWFATFDADRPNDKPFSKPPKPEIATAIPPHRLQFKQGRLLLEQGERSVSGSISAMELLGGWLWGVARAKIKGEHVCVRVLAGTDDAIAGPEVWPRTLDLAYALDRLGHHQEALFLVQRVLGSRRSPQGNATAENDRYSRASKLLGHLVSEVPEPLSPQGSTTQSAAAWLLDGQHHLSPNPLIRRDVAIQLANIIGQTTEQPSRLADIIKPALVLLDDAEPAVQSATAVAFDSLARLLFYGRDYEATLAWMDVLDAKGFNIDWHEALRWECLSGLGREVQAEEAWQIANAMTAPDERMPAQLEWHIDYPSLEVWRVFGELRLVLSDRWVLSGKHPCQELRKKGKTLAVANPDAQALRARIAQRCEAVDQQVRTWVKHKPAQRIGPMLAELASAHATYTGQARLTDKHFSTHNAEIHYRRHEAPYRCEGGVIEAAGLFDPQASNTFVFRQPATKIDAALGISFGIEYRFHGGLAGRALPGRATVTTAMGSHTYPMQIFLGLKENFIWTFDSEQELIDGNWHIEIEVFDATIPYLSKSVQLGASVGRVQQDFSVKRVPDRKM